MTHISYLDNDTSRNTRTYDRKCHIRTVLLKGFQRGLRSKCSGLPQPKFFSRNRAYGFRWDLLFFFFFLEFSPRITTKSSTSLKLFGLWFWRSNGSRNTRILALVVGFSSLFFFFVFYRVAMEWVYNWSHRTCVLIVCLSRDLIIDFGLNIMVTCADGGFTYRFLSFHTWWFRTVFTIGFLFFTPSICIYTRIRTLCTTKITRRKSPFCQRVPRYYKFQAWYAWSW